jgi:sugar phosphate isomerase/epimerase
MNTQPAFSKGLLSISFRQHSAEAIIDKAVEYGFDGIEWGGDVHVPHGDLATAQRIHDLTTQAGMVPFCYGSYYRFREVNPAAADKAPPMQAVLDTAQAMGAQRIRVWMGETDYEAADPATISAVTARAHTFADAALARGIAIDMEFHRGTFNNDATHALRLLEAINHPNIHSLWQPDFSIPHQQRLADLRRMAHRISNLHCYHWGPGGFHDRLPLSEGLPLWQEYLAALPATSAPRWVSLEYVKDDAFEALQHDSHSLSRLLFAPQI